MTNTAIGTKVHKTLDIHRGFAAQIALYSKYCNCRSELRDLGFRQVFDRRCRGDVRRRADLLRARATNTEDRRECDHDMLVQRYVYSCYACHLTFPYQITRELTLALLMPCIGADHPHYTVAANDLAVSANLFN
jgi:hypothetical protein